MITFVNRVDTYTAAAIGSVIPTPIGMKNYGIQVVGTGEAATAWDVRLYGSLDGVNYSEILRHQTATGDGEILTTGAAPYPAVFIRSRCISITLGSATNVSCFILGVP